MVTLTCLWVEPLPSSLLEQPANGGDLFISFRSGESHYDTELDPMYRSKVFLRLLRSNGLGGYGEGTDLYATLGSGEAFTEPTSGLHVRVCGITVGADGGHAADVAVSGRATGGADEAARVCGGIEQPPPTPSPPPSPPAPSSPPVGCSNHCHYALDSDVRTISIRIQPLLQPPSFHARS